MKRLIVSKENKTSDFKSNSKKESCMGGSVCYVCSHVWVFKVTFRNQGATEKAQWKRCNGKGAMEGAKEEA